MLIAGVIVAATLVVQPLANEDVLEPSVRNEVDHALALAPADPPPPAWPTVVMTNDVPFCFFWTRSQVTVTPVTDVFGTNGLSKTDIAIRLVSLQRGGRWLVGTNDVTAAAVEILRGL